MDQREAADGQLSKLLSKHLKHQAFEAELHANAERIRAVIDTGNALFQRGATCSVARTDSYAPESMGRRRWRQSQVLADQFWLQFMRD